MLTKKYILFYLFSCFLIVSCSTKKIYLTNTLRKQIEQKNLDFTKLQYYVDNDIELTREVNSDTAKISSGKLLFSNGKYINQILLKANTRGVCTNVYPNRLSIAFEEGEDKSFAFGLPNLASTNDAYHLYTNEMIATNINKVTYEGNIYNLKIMNHSPRLMIVKSEINRNDSKRRVLKGLTVKDKK